VFTTANLESGAKWNSSTSPVIS